MQLQLQSQSQSQSLGLDGKESQSVSQLCGWQCNPSLVYSHACVGDMCLPYIKVNSTHITVSNVPLKVAKGKKDVHSVAH